MEAEDIVEICHQATVGEDTARLRRLSTRCSELLSVRISDSAVDTCSYHL
jgi:hypothetical protein